MERKLNLSYVQSFEVMQVCKATLQLQWCKSQFLPVFLTWYHFACLEFLACSDQSSVQTSLAVLIHGITNLIRNPYSTFIFNQFFSQHRDSPSVSLNHYLLLLLRRLLFSRLETGIFSEDSAIHVTSSVFWTFAKMLTLKRK